MAAADDDADADGGGGGGGGGGGDKMKTVEYLSVHLFCFLNATRHISRAASR